MSQLIQFRADFEKYHHIDPPTKQDMSLWRKDLPGGAVWQLLKPIGDAVKDAEIWKQPVLAALAAYQYPFEYARKIDGTNSRIHWDGERLTYAGKNDKDPEVNGIKGVAAYMRDVFLEEAFEERFGREVSVTLYGELMGEKIQTNELGLNELEMVLFDVKINQVWLETKDIADIALYFGLRTVFDFMGEDTSTQGVLTGNPYAADLSALIDLCAQGVFDAWEGIVARPVGGLYDRTGKRIIVKIKNHDYLLPQHQT